MSTNVFFKCFRVFSSFSLRPICLQRSRQLVLNHERIQRFLSCSIIPSSPSKTTKTTSERSIALSARSTLYFSVLSYTFLFTHTSCIDNYIIFSIFTIWCIDSITSCSCYITNNYTLLTKKSIYK